jgi:hypothetical protein
MTDPKPQRPLHTRIVRRILRAPFVLLVWLWILIDETLVAAFRPLATWLVSFDTVHRLEAWIGRQNRIASLIILAVPLILIEPPKILAVLLIAEGKVKFGTVLLITSYLIGLVAVERVFHITKPKLMTIGWFAWGYGLYLRVKDWAFAIVLNSPAWKAASEMVERVKAAMRPSLQALRMAGLKLAARVRLLVRR